MAFPTGWTKLAKLTVDNTKVSGTSNLTDFPTLIKDGNLPDDVYSNIESDGKDLRFTTDSDGTTEIPFEIVNIDTTAKTCQIWVKRTLNYNSDTDIYVWGNNSSATAYNRSDTYGSDNVWSSNYKAVYHLDETSGTRYDSTSNQNDLTDNNTVGSGTGKIGTGADFVKANTETLNATDNIGLRPGTNNFTVQVWVKFDSDISGVTSTVTGKLDSNGGWSLGKYSDEKIFNYYTDSTTSQLLKTTTTISVNTLTMLTFVRASSSDRKIYINGVNQTLDNTPTNITGSIDPVRDLYLASYSDTAELWDGIEDEYRYIIGTALSADWIKTEYNNQSSPSTFITGTSLVTTTTFIPKVVFIN